jgi:LuxR family maltose regulon positive regulatory protein
MFNLRKNKMTEYIKLIPDIETGVINAEHLKFTSEEIAWYFSSLGRKISREEAETAWKATGGWPLGINSLAQSVTFEPGKAEYIFTEYIREHLWNKWDSGLRVFMLKTSITDEINLELAAALTGRQDCGEVLQKLCAENAFINRLGNGIYRYHHLFLEFLREMTAAQIAEESAADKNIDLAELNKIAALYYLEQGQLIARHYAVKSGDKQVIMQAMYQFMSYNNPALDEYVEFSKVFNKDVLTEAICEEYPFLYTSRMFTAYLSGSAEEAGYYMDKLYKHLETVAREFPQFLEVIADMLVLDHRFSISFQIERLMSISPGMFKAKQQQGISVTMQLPFIHRSNYDYFELAAPEMMEKFIRSFGPFLHEHLRTARSCLTAGLLLEQNRISEALNYAREAVAEAEETQSQEFIFAARMHLTAAQLALNSRKAAQATLEAARKHITENGAQYLNHNFLALQTLIQLWDNNAQAAKEWLAQYFVIDYERLPLYKVFQHFTTARAWMVLNETEKAAHCLEQLERFSEDFRRPLDKSETGVLRAALEWALGRRREAAAILEKVLCFCQRWGFIRVIANEGDAIEPVLKRIAVKRTSDSGTAGMVDPAFVSHVLLAAHGTALTRPGITLNIKQRGKPLKLSKQQQRMLELLEEGYRYQQIADAVGLSLSTIRSHIMQAYHKLEVNSAVDAVHKARKLGLMENEGKRGFTGTR